MGKFIVLELIKELLRVISFVGLIKMRQNSLVMLILCLMKIHLSNK